MKQPSAGNGDSFIRDLDPRVKLLWLLGNLVLAVTSPGVWLTTWVLASVFITTAWAGISPRKFVPLMKVLTLIGGQVIVLQGALREEGSILWDFGPVKIYAGGLLIGLEGVLVLLVVAMLFFQLVMWTSAEEITLVLVRFRLPQRYAVLAGIALRFMPVVQRDLRAIQEGRQARGLPLDTTWRMATGLISVAVPLILRTIKRANEVALSMELKGFSRFETRTFLNSLEFSDRYHKATMILAAYFLALLSAVVGVTAYSGFF